jgi:hypothetical protein
VVLTEICLDNGRKERRLLPRGLLKTGPGLGCAGKNSELRTYHMEAMCFIYTGRMQAKMH